MERLNLLEIVKMLKSSNLNLAGFEQFDVTMIKLFIILIVLYKFFLAYLIGGINWAIIFSKILYGKDIRNYGSKNAGMSNMLRVFGKKAAILTFIGDFAKGLIAIKVCLRSEFFNLDRDNFLLVDCYVILFFAVLGHIFPIAYGFRGGKGVLVAASSILATDLKIFMLVLLVFLIVFLLTKTISISSICAAEFFPIIVLVHYALERKNLKVIVFCFIISTMISLIIILKHKSNINRILIGEEQPILK